MKYAIALSFVLHSIIGFSQIDKIIDSLKSKLVVSKPDKNRVNNLIQLTKNYWNYKPDSALRYGQIALELSRKIQFPAGESDALTYTGLVIQTLGSSPKALELFIKALRVVEKNNIHGFQEAHALYNIGETFSRLGHYQEGVNNMKRSKYLFNSMQNYVMEQLVKHSLAESFLLSNQ